MSVSHSFIHSLAHSLTHSLLPCLGFLRGWEKGEAVMLGQSGLVVVK